MLSSKSSDRLNLPAQSALFPQEIFSNLRFQPRPYQVEALESWQKRFLEQQSQSSKAGVIPLEVLFHMATGSGKTYLMAALILDLFSRGYQNFIFFVNSTNILEKTRDNFLNFGSPKYLFRAGLKIHGQSVFLREVKTFAGLQSNDSSTINILFTTTQRLHADLSEPHENRLSLSDFSEHSFVLIADEAHHNNVSSLSLNSKISWEDTIEKIIQMNSKNILLEFTGTLDFDKQKLSQKYQNRLIFSYPLISFCADHYSKNISLFLTYADLKERMLAAIIISEYRRLLAEQNQIFLKPVVMFKSRTIFENQSNLKIFLNLIATLSPADLEHIQESASGILLQAFRFFEKSQISFSNLVQNLQNSFHPDNLLRIDGGREISLRDQNIINTLESATNPHRAIFVVDMLKEGWDVLNLFDIVRLYDTVDKDFAKTGRPGKTTLSEVQLIGRGARYCPLRINSKMCFLRQFDSEPENELTILEQLHYHAPHDVRYISEIQSALRNIGIMLYNNEKE